MNHINLNDPERLDGATRARLARLAGRPVDTSRLESRLAEAMRQATAPQSQPMQRSGRPRLGLMWRQWGAAAAVILLGVVAGWLAMEGGGHTAMAAPADLARFHREVVKGLIPHLKVSSVEQANRLLADEDKGVVAVPRLPGALHSCCLRQYAGATLTCALIEQKGRLISVAVADGAKLHSPMGQVIHRDGRSFIAHTANGVNMVMAYKDGRWMCVMGEVPTAALLDVAVNVRF